LFVYIYEYTPFNVAKMYVTVCTV